MLYGYRNNNKDSLMLLLLDFVCFFFRLEIEEENYNPNWKYLV